MPRTKPTLSKFEEKLKEVLLAGVGEGHTGITIDGDVDLDDISALAEEIALEAVGNNRNAYLVKERALGYNIAKGEVRARIKELFGGRGVEGK